MAVGCGRAALAVGAVVAVLVCVVVVTRTPVRPDQAPALRASQAQAFGPVFTDDAGPPEDPDAVAQPFVADTGADAADAGSGLVSGDAGDAAVTTGIERLRIDSSPAPEPSNEREAQPASVSISDEHSPSPPRVLNLPAPHPTPLDDAAMFAGYRLDAYRSKGTEFVGVPKLGLTDAFVLETLRYGEVFELEKEFTSVPKTAFDVLLRVDATRAGQPDTMHRQQVHAYFKIGDTQHGEHVVQEAISHAVDRVFGFYIVPPVVVRNVDLRAVRRRLQDRKAAGDEHAGEELELLESAIRVARQDVKDEWQRTNTLELTGAAVLFYPHEVSPLQISYSVDQATLQVRSKHSAKLNAPTAEYLMLYYILHCPKKRHNVQVDAHRRAFVGIDNDRCPYPMKRLTKPDFLLVCQYRKELAAQLARYGEADAACVAVRQYLREHDPLASAQLEAMLTGEQPAPKSSLLLTKLFHSPGDPPGTCHMGKRVRTLSNVVKWCQQNAGRTGRQQTVLFPSRDALPPDARGG